MSPRIHVKMADMVVHAYDPNIGEVEMATVLELTGQILLPDNLLLLALFFFKFMAFFL